MAESNKLEIETARLQRDIESLRQRLAAMRKSGDQMMEEINALSAMWEGEAKNAFTQQFQSDYATLNNMAAVIEELIADLEEAGRQYDTCEQQVGTIIQSIRI